MKNIIILIVVLVISGCTQNETSNTNTTLIENGNDAVNSDNESCVEKKFKNSISPLLASKNCDSCHNKTGGSASSTLLTFEPLNVSNAQVNYTIVKDYILNKAKDTTGASYPLKLKDKTNGVLFHSGGALLSQEDESALIETFIIQIQDPSQCVDNTTSSEIHREDVVMAPLETTLYNASIELLSSTPTSVQLERVKVGELDQVLDEYMNTDAFYEWVRLRFNDLLATDQYADRYALPYRQGLIPSGYDVDYDFVLNGGVRTQAKVAAARMPIELIVNVIKNQRPFSEILTADYVMLNPFSARALKVAISGFTYDGSSPDNFDANDYREYHGSLGGGIPTSGLLTDPIFLHVVNNTPSNRNRHRSWFVQKYFLDTDILQLTSRAINSNDEFIGEYPTKENDDCTVCHAVMDPIANTFKNFGTGFQGGLYRIQPGYEDSFDAGFSITQKMPASRDGDALRYLGEKIVGDERFAVAVVKLFYKALTGKETLQISAGGSLDDFNVAKALEDEVIQLLAQEFKKSNYDAKALIKAIIKSVLFSGTGVSSGQNNSYLAQVIGLNRHIGPTQLDELIFKKTGFYWSFHSYKNHPSQVKGGYDHYLLDKDRLYFSIYGGVDSIEVKIRDEDINGLTTAIQERMAIEVACTMTPRDFFYDKSQRSLFPFVERETEPIDSGNENLIKTNIQYLYQHLLGESLNTSSPEIARAYNLFKSVYEDSSIGNGYMCSLTKHPTTGVDLSVSEQIKSDENHVLKAWQAVLTYLLSDYKFVTNTTAK